MIIPPNTESFDKICDLIKDCESYYNAREILLHIFCYNEEYLQILDGTCVKSKGSRIMIDWNNKNDYVSIEVSNTYITCYIKIGEDSFEYTHHLPVKISHTVKYELDKLFSR